MLPFFIMKNKKKIIQIIQEDRLASISEEATGCQQSPTGLGTAYLDADTIVSTREDVMSALLTGKTVELPNAGSGSYTKLFTEYANFDEVAVLDWTSSAGDWTFGVRLGDGWYMAGQNNRYPGHGFSYWVNTDHQFTSFKWLATWHS
jgi:hypothetical protein